VLFSRMKHFYPQSSVHKDVLQPKVKTITSFLKGAPSSPHVKYYLSHPDLSGKYFYSEKEIAAACEELCHENVIRAVRSRKTPYYLVCKNSGPLFVDDCTKGELKYINGIRDFVKNNYSQIESEIKTNRIVFWDKTKMSADYVLGWFWITRQGNSLIFKYKLDQSQEDKTLYDDNHLLINAFNYRTMFSEFEQVLPNLSINQIRVLIRELRISGSIYSNGSTKFARWYATKN